MQLDKINKMKKIFLVLMMVASLTSCEQEKTAFVDNTKLLSEYQQKKDIEATFKVKAEDYQKRADSISRAFQAEAMAFEAKSKTISQNKAQEEYNLLMQKRQLMGQQLQAEEQKLQQESQVQIDSMVKKVKEFVHEYGKTNQYTYIFGSTEASSILYGVETKDITEIVLKELNASYTKK